MPQSEMTPRYNLFWYDPKLCWAATIDQVPGMICYGDGPEEALEALLSKIREATFDEEIDGRLGEWCAVCYTTAKECDDNAAKAANLSRHSEFLESVGIPAIDTSVDYDDILDPN